MGWNVTSCLALPIKHIARDRPFMTAFCLLAISVGAHGQATITAITPTQGPIAGGTTVTLAGSGFSGTTLLLDYQPVTPVSSSDTQIVFTTPVHDSGIALVELSGNGPNAYAEFVYMPPTLTSLQPGQITTIMGIGTFTGDGRQATQAMTFPMQGFAVTKNGFYFSEPNNFVIRRVRSDGVVERVAGTGLIGYSGDGGPALQAHLFHPRGMAADAAGNLYFADMLGVSAIRRIDAVTGIISTVGGGATPGYSGDGGPFSQALLNEPLQVTFDGAGNLYILECGGASLCSAPRVRKVNTNQIITTIAGTGSQGYTGDGGPAIDATFNIGPADCGGLAADPSGNVYVADSNNNAVRRIDAITGIITTFLSNANGVRGVTTDSSGNVFVGLNGSNSWSIAKLSPSGAILQTWGNGTGFTPDGASASGAAICQVMGIVLDLDSNILFSEECSARIRRINITTGILDTFAGMGPAIIGDPGTPLTTVVSGGDDLLFTASGNLLTGESNNYRVRQLTPAGNLTDFAGNGFMNFVGSLGGSALNASIVPVSLAQTPNGDVVISDGGQLLSVNPAGNINLIAGNNGATGFSGDGGPATSAKMNQVGGVASDSSGNIYIADTNNNRIRRIDATTGIITTVAGSGPTNPVEGYGEGSTCGDGGPATSACINTPYGVAVAPDGTMYIGENSQRVREVTPAGIISTLFEGTGGYVHLNSAGNLFTDSWRIEPNGHGYMLTFFAGGSTGIGDGGPATAAKGNSGSQGSGVAIDAEGNLYISDMWNRRIRAIRFGAVIAEPGSTVTATAGTSQSTGEGTQFANALQVTLNSPAGNLENGIRVDFAAPTTGPSCLFPNGQSTYSTLTGLDGTASTICVANNQTGSYSVTATPLTLGTAASFSLTNLPAPVANLSPASLTFANQAVGTSSTPQAILLTNTGGALLTIASITVSSSFSETSSCGASLAAGANCTINVEFVPTAPGSVTGTLSISDNAGGSPQTVSLTGTGTAPLASLSLTTLTFAALPVNSISNAQAVTLSNAGNVGLSIASITTSGNFAQTNNCGSSVAANSSCTINVTFTPLAGGPLTGTLTITDNDDNTMGSMQTVSLSGTGVDFTLAMASGSSSSQTVSPGQTATYTLSVGAEGGSSLAVNLTCTGAPSESACSVSPSVATSGSNVTVSVATTAPSTIAPQTPPHPRLPDPRALLVLATLLACIAWAVRGWRRVGARARTVFLPLAAGLLLALALAGCGGGGGGGSSSSTNPGTPAGTYNLTVTGTAGSGSTALSHSVTLTLTVS
jgi:sugar lactone lactonase YvrE